MVSIKNIVEAALQQESLASFKEALKLTFGAHYIHLEKNDAQFLKALCKLLNGYGDYSLTYKTARLTTFTFVKGFEIFHKGRKSADGSILDNFYKANTLAIADSVFRTVETIFEQNDTTVEFSVTFGFEATTAKAHMQRIINFIKDLPESMKPNEPYLNGKWKFFPVSETLVIRIDKIPQVAMTEENN